jgi:hypothetical protein
MSAGSDCWRFFDRHGISFKKACEREIVAAMRKRRITGSRSPHILDEAATRNKWRAKPWCTTTC